jgi:hypothetical protein
VPPLEAEIPRFSHEQIRCAHCLRGGRTLARCALPPQIKTNLSYAQTAIIKAEVLRIANVGLNAESVGLLIAYRDSAAAPAVAFWASRGGV